MAVSTINPWSAGAVVLDQRPFEAFYERQMARQQAKNDALDNYFKDLNKNITTSGMRSQDIPAFLQKNKDWQSHYIQNKAAIVNPKLDNGQAYREYQAGYQDQLALANESKSAQKDDEQLAKFKFGKDTQYIFDDPNIISDLSLSHLPVTDPNYKKFDMTGALIPPKPIGTKEKEELSKYVVGEIKPDKIPGAPLNIGNFQTQTPITHQYSDANKQVFGQRASDAYDTDKSWRVYANQLFRDTMHDPVKYNQLNSIYRKHYGNDIDTPKEAFVAQTIADHDIKTIEYQKGEDKWGLAQAEAAMKHNYTLKEQEAKQKLKDKSAGVQESIVDNLYEGLKEDAKANPMKYEPGGGIPSNQYQIKASESMRKMFAVPGDKGHLIYPDAIRYSNDFKTVTPIFFATYGADDDLPKGKVVGDYKMDKNGRAQVIKEMSHPILESEFRQLYKKEIMGAGAYGKELSKGGGSAGGNDESVNMESLRTKYNY